MAINGIKIFDESDRYAINGMNYHSIKHKLGDALFSTKVSYLGKYDVAVQGGATGTHNLLDASGAALKVPENFVCTNVIIDKQTGVQSAASGADIMIGMNSTTDLLGDTSETALDGTGLHAGIPVGTAATAVRATAERNITLTIQDEALTAGKWYVELEGFLSRSF